MNTATATADRCIQCDSPNVERIQIPGRRRAHAYAYCGDCGHAEPCGQTFR